MLDDVHVDIIVGRTCFANNELIGQTYGGMVVQFQHKEWTIGKQ